MNPMVITAAMVGAETTREQTPYLPITAEEIAEDAAKCREAGAAMVHLHVRTPDGKPSQDTELFRAAIRAIRKSCDVLIQVSTGGAVGMNVDERCGALKLTGADRPDMATLSTGTVNFGADVFWNPRPLIRDIATRIKALGLKPEIECFDVGMIDEARALEKEGFIALPRALRLRARRRRRAGGQHRGARLHALVHSPGQHLDLRGRRPAPAALRRARGRARRQLARGPGGQHLPVQGRAGEGQLRARRRGREARAARRAASWPLRSRRASCSA